jgi:predicted NBD/HSP70 family sugar kinase
MDAILAYGEGKMTNKVIGEKTDVSSRAITSVLRRMGAHQVLVRDGEREPVRFGPGAGLALGISVGAQSIRAGLVDANADVHCLHTVDSLPGQLDLPADRLLDRIADAAHVALAKGLDDDRLKVNDKLPLLGLAVAWPSAIDREKRPMGFVLTHRSWTEPHQDTRRVQSIPERLARRFGGPFVVDRCNVVHNVGAHALSLAFHESRRRTASPGISPPERSTRWRVGIVIRLGEQIGASAILLAPPTRGRLSFIDSKLIEGTNGLAGEIGHLPVDRAVIDEINKNAVAGLTRIDHAGERCSCGKDGHLEAFGNVSALLRRLNGDKPLTQAAREQILTETRRRDDEPGAGNTVAFHASIDIGGILGQALAGAILMLDPWRITLTGPLASERVVRGMQQVGADWGSVVKNSVKIRLESYGMEDLIGLKGAALAVIRQHVYRDYLDARDAWIPNVMYVGAADLQV